MTMMPSSVSRAILVAFSMGLSVVTTGAQTRGNVPAVLQQVRTALGHGDVAAARRAADTPGGDASSRELAAALVDIFEGKGAAARTRLLPLAGAAPTGEAALELGLLEIAMGQVSAGERRLAPIAAVRTFTTPDDYFRLARAAIGLREFELAADAFVRTSNERRADIQAARGDLFRIRNKAAMAMEDYEKALAIDPVWVP